MRATLTILYELIQEHQDKLLPRKSVSISNFQVLSKINYDHSNCDRILLLKQSSKIENMPCVCKEYNCVPDTTIKQLAENT